jgi:hypothetical protein
LKVKVMSSVRRLSWLPLVALGLLAAGGCASATTAGAPGREFEVAYDDAHPSGALAFPSDTYESVVRFQLPEGEHKPLRLRFQAEAPGKLEINIYDSTPLETPGAAIRTLTRDLGKDDLSDGRDGRWVVEDLDDLKPLKGIVWVGVHRLNGTPSIWASSVSSGQAFVRDNDPTNPMGLLPTRRTPMIRLELAP